MSEVQESSAPVAEEQAPIESQEVQAVQSAPEASSAEEQALADLEAKKNPTPSEKKKIKQLQIKVYGETVTEELPFEIDDDPKVIEYMRKQLQMAKASQKAMQEKSQLEKEVGSFLEELKKNPRKILADPRVSVDLKKMAAEIIEEEIEQSKKSPEQIEKEKLEARLRELEEERKKEKEERDKLELERRTEASMIQYDQMMTKALEKSDLPKSPYVVKKMADYMLLGLNNNLDLKPDDVVPLVQEEIKNDLKEMFSVMPDEVIEALVGKEVFSRVRKKNIAKAKSVTPPTPVKSQLKDTGNKSNSAPEKKEVLDYKKFFGI